MTDAPAVVQDVKRRHQVQGEPLVEVLPSEGSNLECRSVIELSFENISDESQEAVEVVEVVDIYRQTGPSSDYLLTMSWCLLVTIEMNRANLLLASEGNTLSWTP